MVIVCPLYLNTNIISQLSKLVLVQTTNAEVYTRTKVSFCLYGVVVRYRGYKVNVKFDVQPYSTHRVLVFSMSIIWMYICCVSAC